MPLVEGQCHTCCNGLTTFKSKNSLPARQMLIKYYQFSFSISILSIHIDRISQHLIFLNYLEYNVMHCRQGFITDCLPK